MLTETKPKETTISWKKLMKNMHLVSERRPEPNKWGSTVWDLELHFKNPYEKYTEDFPDDHCKFTMTGGSGWPGYDIETVLPHFLENAETGWEIYEYGRYKLGDEFDHMNPSKMLEVCADHENVIFDGDESFEDRKANAAWFIDFYHAALVLFSSLDMLGAALEAFHKHYPNGY